MDISRYADTLRDKVCELNLKISKMREIIRNDT